MKRELRRLRQDVLARPDDLTVRRVLADALLEAGDPLGTFISLQCQLGELPADAPDATRHQLEREVRDLIARHDSTWRHPALAGKVTYVNGFVEQWDCTMLDFIQAGGRVVERLPLRRAVLREARPRQLKHLQPSAAFLGLRELELHGVSVAPFEALGACGFHALRTLVLQGHWYNVDESVAPMVEAPWWPALKEAQLQLPVDAGGLAASSGSLAPITWLQSTVGASEVNWRALFERMPALHTLDLDVHGRRTALEPFQALPAQVKRLRVRNAEVSLALASHLCTLPLVTVDLTRCSVTSVHAHRLLTERFGDQVGLQQPQPGPLARLWSWLANP
jgi:uncharacterized protein (TIGR02996 family)